MNDFDQELARQLQALELQGLLRTLRPVASPQGCHITLQGQTLLNFASNDYLGLANDPCLKAAAIQGITRYGAGAGASRLICGTLASHVELEEKLTLFKGTEAALTFTSGYTAAIGTITALLSSNDIIIIDKQVHACVVDAARLCGAKLRVYAHNDLNDLATILQWANTRRRGTATQPRSRVLVVTESIFSMAGDQAPLSDLVALKDRYGAWLMLDEAHATGLYGSSRRGLAEAQGVADRIEIQMGTLSKALGASGGYIAGSRILVDLLVNCARSFIFSTAPTPGACAAAQAAIQYVQSPAGELRCRSLWNRVAEIREGLAALHIASPISPSAIIPLVIGGENEALRAAAQLREAGIFIPAIRYPTVARGQSQLRLTVTARHTTAEVAQLLTAIKKISLRPPTV